MSHQHHRSAIAACYACADACDLCAVSCLNEPEPQHMARCIVLDMDCAQTCRLAAGFMARGSGFDNAACALCAGICEACAAECEKHDTDHCQACALACRLCAEECRRLTAHAAAITRAETGTHAPG